MKRFRFIFLAFIILSTQASSLLFAKKTSYKPSYGMSGCGVGALIIKNNGKGEQLLSWFLERFVGVQTFAMTSGTSNCVEGNSNYAQVEQEVYIFSNLSSLEKDAARGMGDSLYGLSEVFGCENHEEFARVSKDHYEKIYNSNKADVIIQNYTDVINSDANWNKKCKRMG